MRFYYILNPSALNKLFFRILMNKTLTQPNHSELTEQNIQVVELASASAAASALFQHAFGDPVPDFPRHFVLQVSGADQQPLTLGYVHFTQHHNIYLGGGMCIDSRLLRQLSKAQRKALQRQGGPAFTLLSNAIKQLDDGVAVFGHVGHQGAYQVDLAVGFKPTNHPHLIVYWLAELSDEQQRDTIQLAADVGPF